MVSTHQPGSDDLQQEAIIWREL